MQRTLHRLQAEVLLIEFAAWSGQDSLRVWALQQQARAIQVMRTFSKSGLLLMMIRRCAASLPTYIQTYLVDGQNGYMLNS